MSQSALPLPDHLAYGKLGEDIAVRYLLDHGYIIRQRNVRLKRDEIDIIADDPREKMIVFVEVKSRHDNSPLYPIRTAMDGHKRKTLRRAIARWVALNNYDGPGRIDLLCVAGNRVVDHMRDVGSAFLTEPEPELLTRQKR